MAAQLRHRPGFMACSKTQAIAQQYLSKRVSRSNILPHLLLTILLFLSDHLPKLFHLEDIAITRYIIIKQ